MQYVQSIETIKEQNPYVICKQCDEPLIKPMFCENCGNNICQKCLSDVKCCESDKVIYPTDTNNECINTHEKMQNQEVNMQQKNKEELKKIVDSIKLKIQLKYINYLDRHLRTDSKDEFVRHFNKYLLSYQKTSKDCDNEFEEFIKIREIWLNQEIVSIKQGPCRMTQPKYSDKQKKEYAVNNNIFRQLVNDYYDEVSIFKDYLFSLPK